MVSDRDCRSNLSVLLSAFLLGTGCARNSQPANERPIAIQTSLQQAEAKPSRAAPPTHEEAQAAVARVLGSDVVPVTGGNSVMLAGDFNGDASADLVLAVKPVPDRLSEINAALANWIIQNPRHSFVPPRDKEVVRLPPGPKAERVKAGETLLVIIHGNGPEGWRDPLAGQTYLLRQATGRGPRVTRAPDTLVRDFGPFPSPRDVIAENLSGGPGVIYWTGAAYAWHPGQ
jgi:hypothetical protein